MKTFHCTSFVIACSMAVILINVGLLMPTPKGVSVAKAHFDKVEVSIKSEKAPIVDIDMLPAAGPTERIVSQNHLNYDLDAVLSGDDAVPRITLASLPDDLFVERESRKRKALFLKTVLPLVLQANEQILEDRSRLARLQAQQGTDTGTDTGTRLAAVDRFWLAVMADRYGTERGDIGAVLNRHDVIPPSLALAQAATESAWGSSRFVREGNAMFGQWTFSTKHSGIVPADRQSGKSHRVRAFGSLSESIDSYVTNLNKHRAYKEFRALRAAMRRQGQPLDGMQLAGTLYRYSERGAAYVAELRAIISSNALRAVDGARLSSIRTVEPLI